MEAGLLFYQDKVLVPGNEKLRIDILKLYHDSPLAGHPGRQRTLELVMRKYYWPGMRSFIYAYVDNCEYCQRARKAKKPELPIQPLNVPSRPWQVVSYDMI